MLFRSDLSGVWYVATWYKPLGNGVFEAFTKHALPDNQQQMLEAMREGHTAATIPAGNLPEPAGTSDE
jgi:hypothetical protein